jgi:hypothetical protein
MTLPKGYQQVFVYFSGQGNQEYFTASSMEEAAEFILSEKEKTEWNSAFATMVIVKAEGSYFFINGKIPAICNAHTKVL